MRAWSRCDECVISGGGGTCVVRAQRLIAHTDLVGSCASEGRRQNEYLNDAVNSSASTCRRQKLHIGSTLTAIGIID